MEVGGGIFWVGRNMWKFLWVGTDRWGCILGGWEWVDIFYRWMQIDGLYFWWVRVGGHLLCVDGDGWWYMEVYFACVGMSGQFL